LNNARTHDTHTHTCQPEFLEAVRKKDVEAVGMFLDEGYQVLGETLIEAVQGRSVEMVQVRLGGGNGRTGGRTDGRTDGCMDGWMGGFSFFSV